MRRDCTRMVGKLMKIRRSSVNNSSVVVKREQHGCLFHTEPSHLELGMSESRPRPPLRARLHWYRLTASELAVLTAMCEACSDGSEVYAAVPRLAAYAKLTRRQVDRFIHGYVDPRTATRVKGFVERGILTQLAPPGSRKRTAIYRINEDLSISTLGWDLT